MSAGELDSCRRKLEKLNEALFQTFSERKKLSHEIKKHKIALNFPVYDPEREKALFMGQQELLKRLGLKEMAAFSLLMEEHAGAGYPKWSEAEHLAGGSGGRLSDLINPLLLLIFHPDEINVESLKDEYRFLSGLAGREEKDKGLD